MLQSYSLLQLDIANQRVTVHRMLQEAAQLLDGVERPIDDGRVTSGLLVAEQPAVFPAGLSLSWYALLMRCTVDAYVQMGTPVGNIPHLDELQRRYYHPAQRFTSLSFASQLEGASSTSAKAALQQCLAEYEQLPHLQQDSRSHMLFHYLALVGYHERCWADILGFVQRAHRLREALPAGIVPVVQHAACMHLQRTALLQLARHDKALLVCEQMLGMAKQRPRTTSTCRRASMCHTACTSCLARTAR